LLAGWLNEFYGWRVMFVVISVPGLALATLARLTLQEPRLCGSMSGAIGGKGAASSFSLVGNSKPVQPSLKVVFITLWANKTFRYLLVSYAVLSFFSCGITNWQPAFFVRSFGLKTGELGAWLALVYGSSTVVGSYLGGAWATRYAPGDEPLQLKVMAIGNVFFSGVLWAPIYFAHNYYVAFGLMWVANMGGTAIYGPMLATLQTLVAPSMRAVSIALVFLFGNLIGLGLGPLAVGALSGALRPLLAEESLRYALLSLCPGYLWASWHLWQASKTVARDLAALPIDDSDAAFSTAGGGNVQSTLAALSHEPS
jgi:predicted MFS family arabinose efflux permease